MKIQSKTKLNHKGEQSEVGYINLLQDGYLTIDNLERGDYVLTMYVQCDSIGNISIGEQSQDITTSWNKVSYILSNVENIINIKFKKGVYYIYEVKLEKGNKATDWTPAPEDTEESINNVNTKAQGIIDNIYTPNTTTIDGGKITTGSIKAAQIDVNNLFAQNITATGTITGATLKGTNAEITSGSIAAWKIEDNMLVGFGRKGNDSYSVILDTTNTANITLIIQRPDIGIKYSSSVSGEGFKAYNLTTNEYSSVEYNSIIENGTALSEKYAPISHSHDYLPLSGGTVTGSLVVNSDLTGNGNITGNRLYSVDCKTAATTAAPNCYITSDGRYVKTSTASSKRFKKDIKKVHNEELNPEALYDVEVVQFKYKKGYFSNEDDIRYGQDMIGFIAEDVYKKYKIAADYHIDDNGEIVVDGWNAQYMIPAMLKLIQNQNERINKLEDIVQGKSIQELSEQV